MKQLNNLVQGTDEWKANRANQRNASEAGIVMGVHPNVKRDELLHMKATGTEQEFSDFVQRNVLDRGHEVEALARPIIEKQIDDELFPVVGASDDEYLYASFDGLSMLGDIQWECKQWNKSKAELVSNQEVPEADYWQVVHQMAVSGAETCIYTVTDGTEENTVSVEVKPSQKDTARLLRAWQQFDEDLAAYKAKLADGYEQPEEATAEVIKDLPAITYQMNGLALTSNLKAFEQQAQALIEKSREPLVDDDDFATAEKLVKVFKTAEDKLDGIAEQVLGEVQDIDQFTKDLKFLKEQIRQARLDSDKQVKAEKERRRLHIINESKQALQEHIDKKNELLEGVRIPEYYGGDFAAAMKGKKTIASLQSSANDTLAAAKIDIDQMFDEISMNLKTLNELAADHKFLFADLQQIISKEQGDFTALVKSRIADHKEAEAKRIEAERERIRQEEEAKAKRQAEAELLEAEYTSKAAKKGDDDEPMPIAAEQKQSAKIHRPSHQEIIEVLAAHYDVPNSTVRQWLAEWEIAA